MPFTTMPLSQTASGTTPRSISNPLAANKHEMPSSHKLSLKALHRARRALASCFGHGQHRYADRLTSGDKTEPVPSPVGREGDKADAGATRCNLVLGETDAPPVDEPSRLLQVVRRACPSNSSSAYDSISSSSGSTWDTDKRGRWERARKLQILTNMRGEEDMFEEDERERKKLEEEMSRQDEAWREELQQLKRSMESLWAEHAKALYGDSCKPFETEGESHGSSPATNARQDQGACAAGDSSTKSGVNGGGDASNKPGWEFKTALGSADVTAGSLHRELLDQVIDARTRPNRGKVLPGVPREDGGTQQYSGVEQQRLAYSEYWTQDRGYDSDVENGYRGLGARLVEKRRLKVSSGRVVRHINRWRRGERGNN